MKVIDHVVCKKMTDDRGYGKPSENSAFFDQQNQWLANSDLRVRKTGVFGICFEVMSKQVALYAWVSTDEQTADNQLQELRVVAGRMDWHIVQEYVDQGISGSKDRHQRPAYDEMCKAITRRDVDMVMAWSVDRLGRSLQQLIRFLSELQAKNIDLYLHQQGIDTSTPAGKAMFQMCGVFAEFEQSMIKERVKTGLARAKSQGKKLGRPRVSASIEQAIRKARQQGKGIKKIAKELNIGVSTVQRVIHTGTTE